MHGTEHWQSRVPDVSPLRSPMTVFPSLRINASWLAATFSRLAPVSRNGLSLARNGCSLAEASIPRSTFPACYFESSRLNLLPVRSVAPLPLSGLPRSAAASSRRTRYSNFLRFD